MYPLDGTERIEKTLKKVPAGDCITTKYFHQTTGEMVRSDIEIVVDQLLMQSLTNK